MSASETSGRERVCRAEDPGQGATTTRDVADLYRRFHGYCRSVLQHLGVPTNALDDAVQDVFVVVHRRRGDFELRSTPQTWIFGIARRVAAQHRRKHHKLVQRLEGVEHAASERLQVCEDESPEDHVARAQAEAALQAFVDSLSDEQRAVFVMHVFEDKSGAEIADALGLSPNTAYSRLRLVRQRFERLCMRHSARYRAQSHRQRAWLLVWSKLGLGSASPTAMSGLLLKVLLALITAAMCYGAGYRHGRRDTGSDDIALLASTQAPRGLSTPELSPHPPTPPEPVTAKSQPTVTAAGKEPAVVSGGEPNGTSALSRSAHGGAELLEHSPSDATEKKRREVTAGGRRATPRSDGHARVVRDGPAGANRQVATLREELELVAALRQAASAGNDSEALRLAKLHAERFERGALAPEREAYGALVECRAERNGARAREFIATYPTSALIALVRTACSDL